VTVCPPGTGSPESYQAGITVTAQQASRLRALLPPAAVTTRAWASSDSDGNEWGGASYGT
jgi:hypothetical protein